MEHPPVTLRATPLSPKLQGNFGLSPVTIARVMTADFLTNNAKYTNNDLITIQFSENTDNGRPASDPKVSQTEIESMFKFSQNICKAYTGSWLNFLTIRIVISDITGADPPVVDQLRVRVW
jgi:hypothetical protein